MSNDGDAKRWRRITRIGIVLSIIVAIFAIIGYVSGFIGDTARIISSIGHVTIVASPTARVTPSPVPSATPTPRPTPTSISQPGVGPYDEIAGGEAHTWTNYTNAGGVEGPTIAAYQTVKMSCKIKGFPVQDGNTWWYRIASSPWNNGYYVSADAFYNNGQTSGSLLGTPPVDPRVPDC